MILAGRLMEGTAALMLSLGVVNGVSAYETHQAANQAEAAADAFARHGREEATELYAEADQLIYNRNLYVVSTGSYLAASGMLAFAGVTFVSAGQRRRREDDARLLGY